MCLSDRHSSKLRRRPTPHAAARRKPAFPSRVAAVTLFALTVSAAAAAATEPPRGELRAGDPLAACIADALDSNAALRAQDFAVEAAAQGLAAARAQRAPQLSLNARYTLSEGGRVTRIPTGDLVNPIYQTLNQLTAGSANPTQFPTIGNNDINFLRPHEQDTRLTVTAPIYAPQIGDAIRIRSAELDGSTATREAFARTLVRDVKAAYFQLAQVQAGIGILEASRVALVENQRVAESLVAAGKATRDRSLRAEAERLAIEQRLDAARADERNARRYLNLLRNHAQDEIVVVQPDALDRTVPAAVEPAERPELRGLDARIAAADGARSLAESAYLPTLSFVGDSGIQGTGYTFNRDADVSTASLVLRWTLFDFGARRAAVSQARAQAEQLKATRDDVRRQLDLARLGAQDRVGTASRAVVTAEARQRAAEESFRIAERKRDAGQLSQVEFLDAERAATEARLGLVIARTDLQIALADQEYTAARYPLSALAASSTPAVDAIPNGSAP